MSVPPPSSSPCDLPSRESDQAAKVPPAAEPRAGLRHGGTSDGDRVPLVEKLSYGSGLVGFMFGNSGVNALAYPFFNIMLGVSPTLIGIVLAVSRLWEAFTDPIMGAVSDNSRLKGGRRKPFILLGSVLCALTFPLIWFVPTGLGQVGSGVWFLVASLVFFTAFAIFSIPYLSLGYELTPDNHERTRVAAVSSFVGKIAGMGLQWIYPLAQAGIFASAIIGVRTLGVLIGICFLLFAIPVCWKCRERFQKTAAKQKKIGILAGVRETFKNRPFLQLVSIVMLMQASTSMIGALGLYVNSYYIFGGDTKTGAAFAATGNTLYSVLSIFSIPLVAGLARRLGKKTVMAGCLAIGIAASFSKFFLYRPDLPYLQFVSIGLIAPSYTAFWVLVGPMKADTADYDESLTGLRREGTYAAVSNWIEKLGLTAALVLSGLIFDLSGFDVAQGANQSAGTFLTLRILFAFVPALAMTVGLALLYFYPLSEKRMYEIRDQMESRRGAV